MNADKLGGRTSSQTRISPSWRSSRSGFDIPYRTLEGITRELEEWVRFVEEMHYTHMRRRILASMKGKKPSEIVGKDADGTEPMTVIADSTGLSVSNKGSYIEDMWKKEKRKYVKLHILADKKTGKIKGFRITSEKTRDNAKFVPMVKEVVAKKKRVAKVYADAAYDARANFNLLREIGAEPAIKLRKNASFKLMGSQGEEGRGHAPRRPGIRRMEEREGLREEVARRDNVLRVQASLGRDAEREEVPQPEGRGVVEGHALQQVPLDQALTKSKMEDANKSSPFD